MNTNFYIELQEWTYEEDLGGIYFLRNDIGQVLAEHLSSNKEWALVDLVKDYNLKYSRKITYDDATVLAKI